MGVLEVVYVVDGNGRTMGRGVEKACTVHSVNNRCKV